MATERGTAFTVGAEVRCSDGVGGRISRVVLDPVAEAVTHLVITPAHGGGPDRLAPVGMVGPGPSLSVSLAEFERLDPAEETHFLPGQGPYGGYAQDQFYVQPYFGLGGMGPLVGGTGTLGIGATGPEVVTDDLVPPGEVAIRRGEAVHAVDGSIGRVQGLVVDPQSYRVTHVLLQEGHLWGTKQVAIPIQAVADVNDGIRLNLSRQAVAALPPVDVKHPGL